MKFIFIMRYSFLFLLTAGISIKSAGQSSFLTVNSGSSIIVNNATITIGGTLTSNGTFDVTNGTLDLYGLPMQTIPAGAFVNNTIKNLVVRNAVTLAGPDTITGTLSFGKGNTTLVTDGYLTLKSTAAGTARVTDVTNRGLYSGNTIIGDVTVERYIPARKAWHFLSVPTNTSQTIKETWQEGALNTSSNPVAGYGTQVTSNRSSWASDGFDLYSAGGPSMKTFDTATNTWIGITNTNTNIKTAEGYMTFIRGDRTANAFNSVPVETTLRTKAGLYVGDQTPIMVGAGKFASIGNRYASDLDMRRITKTGLKEFFYIWDPSLGGSYGYGAYQTFSYNGSDYVITPGLGSYDSSGSVSNYIRSGQAFFVQGDVGGGNLTFKENAKVDDTLESSSARELPGPQLRVNLYGVNPDNSTYMTDGLLINYDDSYSNNVDDMDASKSTNSSENLSVKTLNNLLVIERRHTIVQNDTIFLNLANTKVRQYRFELRADQLDQPGLTGFLEDRYLQTSTILNLNGSAILNFSIVNIPGSYAPDRFRIVFNQEVVLPVTFTSVKAWRQNSHINIEWKVENEINISQYEIEKSANGIEFAKIAVSAATGNNNSSVSYSIVDAKPVEGYNYFRIKSVDTDGRIKYTKVVKVLMGKAKQEITVYPNPVIDEVISLQLDNMPAGNYTIKLLNNLGQEVLHKIIQHAEGSSAELITIDKNLSRGIYQLVVWKPDGEKINISVIY